MLLGGVVHWLCEKGLPALMTSTPSPSAEKSQQVGSRLSSCQGAWFACCCNIPAGSRPKFRRCSGRSG